jgi:hypothetical protein
MTAEATSLLAPLARELSHKIIGCPRGSASILNAHHRASPLPTRLGRRRGVGSRPFSVISDHHSLLSRLPTPFLKNRSTPFFKPLMPPPLQPLEASDWTLVFVTSAAVQKVGQIASRCRWGYE